MITVADILEKERFSFLKLINKGANLNREVTTVEATETPDVYNYIPSNTFLITTGMIYKDNQEALCKLIKKLDEISVSALGIKLGRFIDELEPQVIETADRLGFPLVLIPRDMTTGDVFHQLLAYIWDNQNEHLLYALNIQKKFYNLTLKDASIDMLVRSLAHTLKKSVALVDPFGNIIVSTNNLAKNYYKKSIREFVESLSSDRYPTSIIQTKIINSNNEEKFVFMYPIRIANHYPYFLIVFDSKNMIFSLSKMVIEQAALVIAFTLYKNLRASYNLMSVKESFIQEIIKSNNYNDLKENQLLSIGSKHGIKFADSYQIILGTLEDKDIFIKNTLYGEERYTLIYNWLDDKIDRNMENCVLFPDKEMSNFIILICGEVKDLEKKLSSYRKVLQNTLRLDIIFSVGNKVAKLEDLRYSYREAQKALLDGTIKNNMDFIKYYKPLEASDLLRLIPDNELKAFSSYTLKSLASPKDKFEEDLRETLKTYLDFNCDVTKTAEALFIHRNTVLYRIKRCGELLGKDIDDPRFNLGLRLSLLISEE